MPDDALPGRRRAASATLLILVLVLVVGLASAARGLSVEVAVETLRTWAAVRSAVGMLGFGLAYAAAALLFVPGALLTVVAGGLFGLGWGIVIVALATSLADAVAFLVARYLARGTIERVLARYPLIGTLDRAVTAGGWRMVALLRLSPTIPYSASNYLYGLTGIAFLPYLVTSGIFTLPGICAYVYLGYIGAEIVGGDQRTAAEWSLMIIGFTATILVTAYLALLARRELARADVR